MSRAYKKFKALGIYTPMDLSRWAGRKGFLDVHIIYDKSRFRIDAWEVRKLFGDLESAPYSQRFNTLPGKDVSEETAKDWASVKFDVDVWCRIEGMGNTLFPLAVAEYVKEQVGVRYVKRRQHSKG